MAASDETDGRKGNAQGFAGLALLVSDVDEILRSVQRGGVFARREMPAAPTMAARSPGTTLASPEPTVGVGAGAPPIFSQAPSHGLPPPDSPRKSRRTPVLVAGIGIVVLVWLVSLIVLRTVQPDPGSTASAPGTTTPSSPAADPTPAQLPAPTDARAPDTGKPGDPAPAGSPADTASAVATPPGRESRTGQPEPVAQPAQATPAATQEAAPRPAPDTTTLAVQRRLRELGYNTGTVDGIADPRTREAIMAFQIDHGHTATGAADPMLLRQLDAALERLHIGRAAGSDPAPGTRAAATGTPQTAAARTAQTTPARPPPTPAAVTTTPRAEPAATQSVGQPTVAEREIRPAPAPQAASPAATSGPAPASAPVPAPAPSPAQPPAPAPARQAPAQPDVSTQLARLGAFERVSIEMACAAERRGTSPGQYESCLRHQLTSLAASPGRPDLLQASTAEQVAIENACGQDKRSGGPARYYQCLRRELGQRGYRDGGTDAPAASRVETATTATSPSPQAPARSAAESILAGTSAFERTSIERACASQRAGRDPSNYDGCLRWQMANLTRSGRPDLSGATAAERLILESACPVERNDAGPVQHYDCLRREMSRLGIE